jgi:ATP-binding cassette, subfamily B, bacterial
MAGTFTRRDRITSRQTHILFWKAILGDWPNLILWLFSRPLALVVYNVLIPLLVAYGLQAIVAKDFNLVSHYAIWVLILSLIYCILWGIGGIAIARNARMEIKHVQRIVFNNYLNKDYEFYSDTYLGALGTQATSLREAVNQYGQLIFNGVAKEAVIVISSIAIIAYHSWLLALVTFIAMLIILSFTIASSRWRLKYRRELSTSASETAGVIGDSLSHGAIVKSFAREKFELNRMNESLEKLAETQFWSWLTSIPVDIGRMTLAAITTALMLILTARLYIDGAISIAIVALVQLYVLKLVASTQDIADLIKQYETTMSSAHTAVKTMLINPSVTDMPDAKPLPRNFKPEITFENVSFHYKGAADNIFAVSNFSLDVKSGERVGLVGYSGSGKTTLTKLLLRFMDVSSGSILINGINLKDVAQTDLRKHIAYVPQEPLLFHRSIAENIRYGNPKASQKSVIAAAKAAYVNEFAKELPKGYDTLVGERGVKLSGGQRQRVAIARAILKDAKILVLDEATSSLDSRSETYIQKALWHLMKDRTALVIAHRLSTVQHMDRIVIMDKGKCNQVGNHTQLLADDHGIYAMLWKHQSGGYIGNTRQS